MFSGLVWIILLGREGVRRLLHVKVLLFSDVCVTLKSADKGIFLWEGVEGFIARLYLFSAHGRIWSAGAIQGSSCGVSIWTFLSE